MILSAKPLYRWVLAAAMTASLALPPTAASSSPVRSATEQLEVPESRAGLDARFTANRAAITAAHAQATAADDGHRSAALQAISQPDRQFLSFDGRGDGLAVEVFGRLDTAERVAIVVPGSDTTLDTYDRLASAARSISTALTRLDPNERTAVIAWLGHRTPRLTSPAVLTTDHAEAAALELRDLVDALRRSGTQPDVALLCHSYGSVVCGHAAPGLDVSDIAVVGSPGLGATSVNDLVTDSQVWAARSDYDWIARVPNGSLTVFGTTIGFGADPTDPDFGARTFAAGDGGHTDYFRPGSVSLHNLAAIASGRTSGLCDD